MGQRITNTKNTCIRFWIFLPAALIVCSPLAFVSIDMVGSPIIIMFTNIVIPAIVMGIFLIAGPYDIIVDKLMTKFKSH